MKQLKQIFRALRIAIIGFILLVLMAVEFILGFIVAICDHWSDATTAIQNLYNEVIRPADNKGPATK